MPRVPFAIVGAVVSVLASGPGARAQQPHAGAITSADREAGGSLYAAQCASCHGAGGDQVPGVDLARGRFRAGDSDEALARSIAEGIPGTAMRAHQFDANEMSALIAFIRSMGRESTAPLVPAPAGGNAAAGRTIVEGRGGCLSCHRINGAGARRAADLSDIGSTRTPEAIFAALLKPLANVAPSGRFVRAVTRDGRVVTGRRLNEDTFTVQVLDDRDQLVSLDKADLREYSATTALPSPVHGVALTEDEQRDLVAYLTSLTGPDPAAPRGGRP